MCNQQELQLRGYDRGQGSPFGEVTIRAQMYTCSLFFWGNIFEMLAVTVTAFKLRGTSFSSIQFEHIKCILTGSYTVTVVSFVGN